jgi:DNA invertase Pin-like site-specific DNA recombinase
MVAEYERENIKFRLNSGRELAKNKGVKMGRKTGTTLTKEDREKKYKEVIKMLRKGLTVKQILTICKAENIKVGEATIWKLKKEFCD